MRKERLERGAGCGLWKSGMVSLGELRLAVWESRRGPPELIGGGGRWVAPSRLLGCWQAKRATYERGKARWSVVLVFCARPR